MKYDDFKAQFFNGKTKKRGLIESLKAYSPDFISLKKILDRFEREYPTFKSFVKQALWGTHPLPTSFAELNQERPLYNSESLEKELSWEIIAAMKGRDIINLFLQLKGDFEHFLFSGKYEDARTILDKIETDISISYWSMENRLILDQFQFGTEKNWETRNLYLDEKNANIVQITADFYSVKTETKFSFFQFNEYYDAWEKLQLDSIYGLTDRYRDYLRFKVNYFSRRYGNYSDILYTESTSSLIDRYLMLVRILQHLLITYSEENSFLMPMITQLATSIDDIAFVQMKAVIDSTMELKDDNAVLKIIDFYTLGQYQESLLLSNEYIVTKGSNVMELYEIYVKSLIELQLAFQPLTEHDSIANQIAKIYFDIYMKNEFIDNAFVDLVKLSYVFNNSAAGLHFYAFVAEQLDWKTDINYSFLKRLNSKFINPSLCNNLLKNALSASKYLQQLLDVYGNTATISMYSLFRHNFLNEIIEPFVGVPSVKSELYKCRSLLLKGQFLDAIMIYDTLLQQQDLSPIALYEIYSNLFHSYLKLSDYRNCMITFVNAYLNNQNFIKRMDASELLSIIVAGKFKNIGIDANLIELPIFFRINNAEKIRVKQSFELFLKANESTTASGFLQYKERFSPKKLIYFLRNVCISDTMQLSKYMESTYRVNEERIRICQELALIDVENVKVYNQEIATITQRNAISKVIARIDEGKIYVNEEKIKSIFLKPEIKTEVAKLNTISSEVYLTKEYFYRTVDLQKFTEHKEYKQSNKVLYADYDLEGNMKFKNNPVYDSFRSMFLEVRDNFVSNNEFGLDAYLSTRIRHGTLPNHIRSVFELLNLVTAQTDGVYGNNDYWQGRLDLSGERNEKIQQLLANFSRQVDEISSVLKEDWIQSKTERRSDKPIALFDYSYKNDYELLPLYMSKVEKYEDFIDMCFAELWVRTDICLEKIKYKLHEEVKQKFIELITDLEQELESLSNQNDLYELKNNVTLSRTEIQILLSNIIKWFQRSESSYDGEYELKMLAETSVQITKNINPAYNFEIELDVSTDIAIKGDHHQHVIDIIRNFLENMIKRSGLSIEHLNPKMNIDQRGNLLTFCFSNKVAEDIVNADIFNKLASVKQNWGISDKNISLEDGTGFPKIKKILHYDLDRQNSQFEYSLNDDRQLSLTLTFESTGLTYENIDN